MTDVCVCFELNTVHAPLLRGVKSYARAMQWSDEDMLNRYFVLCAVDSEPEVKPPRDLFEWAKMHAADAGA